MTALLCQCSSLSSRTFIADALELDLLLSTRLGQIGEVSGSVWQAAGGAGDDDHHAVTTEQLSASTDIKARRSASVEITVTLEQVVTLPDWLAALSPLHWLAS